MTFPILHIHVYSYNGLALSIVMSNTLTRMNIICTHALMDTW